MTIPNPYQEAGPRLARAAGRALFGQDAAGYHAGRLDYPVELYQRIFDQLGHEPVDILEIGGGTGLATQALLAAKPRRLKVLEPDPALTTYLRARFDGSGLDVVEGSLEAVANGEQFDLIVAAASFHWLDPSEALGHARRLLRPGGIIATWWNVYRQPGIGDPLADAIMPRVVGLRLPPSEGAAGHYSLDAALHRSRFAAAGFIMVDEKVFRRERILSRAELRALYSSYSFVRALPAEEREIWLDTLDRIVVEQFDGVAPNIVLTPLYIARAPA